ncbi:Protein tyrosine phosphatase shp1/cofactor for p97 atpase-mediated vesicle membrane fusion [Gryllus bimaculatus]|nr:Protein tyrosine phosphatase shp1/cofactor for p97 atpase-mediated vesicle membrane fusion [Gryllus bimaculatus]
MEDEEVCIVALVSLPDHRGEDNTETQNYEPRKKTKEKGHQASLDKKKSQYFSSRGTQTVNKMALASFYENDGEDESPAIEEPDNDADDELPSKHTMTTRKAAAQQKKNSRFGTIASLHQSEEGSSDEEEGQAFYAGGSEHSGQQVLGPGKKKKDIVSEMFRSVQQHGAEVVDPEATSSMKKPSTFSGTGYRLGQTGNDSEVVRSSSSLQQSHSEFVLKLWKEGFSINEGPLRNYTDPDNREFLESVRRGEFPQELIRDAQGQEIHLNMEDHRHVEFVPSSKPKLKAFTGKGHVLGSPSPAAVGVTVALDDKDRVANEEEAKGAIAVDPERPATTVQIRLADGSRLLGRFNLTHTVADVRRYITIARPQYEHQSFTLLTTFPSKELENSLTLDQAGLSNAAVLQRLT